jgi:hypothetical protein
LCLLEKEKWPRSFQFEFIGTWSLLFFFFFFFPPSSVGCERKCWQLAWSCKKTSKRRSHLTRLRYVKDISRVSASLPDMSRMSASLPDLSETSLVSTFCIIIL